MEFRDWLSSGEDVNEIKTFLGNLTKQVLASMHQDSQGRVVFTFPSYAQKSKEISQPIKTSTSVPLVAHTIHEAKMGRPKLPGSDKDWANRHKKGWQVYKSLQTLVDPQKDLGWTGQQVGNFKRSMTANIRKIATPLGFLFETEVFLYLRDNRGFHDGDEGAMNVEKLQQQLMQQIQSKMGITVEQVFQMVKIHAKDMGDQIITRVKKILGCADIVWFDGGNYYSGRTEGTDLIVGCSERHAGERDRISFGLKFGTETRVPITNISIVNALKLVSNGKEVKYAADEINQAESHEDWVQLSLDKIYEFSKQNFEDNPKRFIKLLNHLLTGGGEDVFPAVRNYGSTELGGADWSGHMQADFHTSNAAGNPLRMKDNAIVKVDQVNTYVRITYTRKGGSISGTTIYIVPSTTQKSINFKVNNLTSSRGTRKTD